MKYKDILLIDKLLESTLKLPLVAKVMVPLLVCKSGYNRALSEFEARRISIINSENADEETKCNAVEKLAESECENFTPDKVTIELFEVVLDIALKQGKIKVMGREVEVAEFAEVFYNNLVAK